MILRVDPAIVTRRQTASRDHAVENGGGGAGSGQADDCQIDARLMLTNTRGTTTRTTLTTKALVAAGEDDDFGYPVCAGPFACVPVSCYETYRATGDLSWDGLTMVGTGLWTFTATVRLYSSEGEPKNVTYSCPGAAGFTGNKRANPQKATDADRFCQPQSL